MAHKTGAKGGNRNFGLDGGAGKGDADRTNDRREFNANFDEIRWTGAAPLFRCVRKGNKLVKHYL